VKQLGKARLVRPELSARTGEMVEHNWAGEGCDLVPQCRDHGQARVDLQAPAASCGALRGGCKRACCSANVALAPALKVDAHAPHTGRVEPVQLGVGSAFGVDHRDPACPAAEPVQRLDQAAIVHAIDAGLDKDDALDPEAGLKSQELVQRR
jgi:hypothetical protein